MRLIKFQDFLRFASFFYKTVGIRPFEEPWLVDLNRSPIEYVIFYVSIVNLNLNTMCEAIFALSAFIKGINFIEGTVSLTYVGFDVVCSSKMLFIWLKKEKLDRLVHELYDMFPKHVGEQSKFRTQRYLQRCSNVTFAFSLLYMILIWTYNLFAFAQWLIYDCLLRTRSVEQMLPYTMFIPWNYQNHWSYYLLYGLQSLAGYTSAAGQISGDLLLCSLATQVIMHYDHVGRSFETYHIKTGVSAASNTRRQQQFEDDMKFLKDMARYHNKVLSLSDLMNDVFGVPLLINFMTSCFVICFVGFQLTIGEALWDEKFELFLFLLSSVAQVYLICHHGQLLIEASTDITRAVYDHGWFNADTRYKKMLTLFMSRAQKPALLKATLFLDITHERFSELMNTSYSYFTLLKAMYAEREA